MTLGSAIARFDTLHPNEIPYEQKVTWLSELDGIVHSEIIALHEGAPPSEFTGYILQTPGTTQLAVPFPYDRIYIEYLNALAELVRGDAVAYNNAIQIASVTFDAFAAEYNRTHTPLQTARIRL